MERTYRAGGRVVKRRYLPPVPALLLLLACVLTRPAGAQGLPAFSPINPVATSRTGLSFQPYRDRQPGWSFELGAEYASTIEDNQMSSAAYLLDTELLRLRLVASRDLGPRVFALAEAELGGAYGGFLDGFLEWYHDVLGIEIPERERRPRDDFAYTVALTDGSGATRRPSDLFLGDLRLGLGVRVLPVLQSMVALTLPTSTGPAGYGREVVSVNLLNTVRAPLNPRLIYEGSLSAGYTPAHGRLARWERELLVAASSGLRFRFWGRQALYANLFYHSPYYEGTTLQSLDRRELSLDFGWILAAKGGREWRVGMTEDLEPGGPAIDLIFRVGAGF